MLRSRCDSFGLAITSSSATSTGSNSSRRKLSEQADGGDSLLHAPPAAAGPVEHRPHQRQTGALAGEPTDDLHPPTRLDEGALYEVGVPNARYRCCSVAAHVLASATHIGDFVA